MTADERVSVISSLPKGFITIELKKLDDLSWPTRREHIGFFSGTGAWSGMWLSHSLIRVSSGRFVPDLSKATLILITILFPAAPKLSRIRLPGVSLLLGSWTTLAEMAVALK